MIKYFIYFLLLVCIPLKSGAQMESKLFSIDELKEDFNYWRDKLERKNPMLYYYNSKSEVDRFLDSLFALIDHPMSDLEFYNLVSPATFFLKDVHSGIQASPVMYHHIVNHPSILPIDIVWLNQGAYVSVSDSLNQIKRGSQVLSINGVDISHIVRSSIERMPNDGYSIANSIFNVSTNFWMIYHRIYDFNETYKIEYINELGAKDTIELKGSNWRTLWELRKGMDRPMFKDDVPLITLEFIDTMKTAILRVRSFDNNLFKDSKQGKFDPQIKAAIKQIQDSQASNLILDIRGNGGGDPLNGKLILKYLLDKKFTITQELRVVKKEESEDFYERTKKTWLPFFGLGKFKPYKNQFKGEVYVLIDGGTSSAAGEFSGVLKREKNVEFIGSEAGGNPIILTGRYLKSKDFLPNTKLHYFVGTICSINGDLKENEGFGVIPDHIIHWKPIDLLNINDPERLYTYNLIQKNNHLKEILGDLKDSINNHYGLYEGAPCINSGPCGSFANLFYEKWNKRFNDKVSISFIMSADSSECYHVQIKLPNGDYYDGGNGILTKRQLVEGYEDGMYIIDMIEYDIKLLEEMSYGLEREYPRCPNYSVVETSKIIDEFLNELLED
jgi:hypothetical protein